MTVRTYNLTLDTFTAELPEPVIIRRGDKTGSVRIVATLKDNGTPLNLTGKKLAFIGMTANNDAIVNDTAVTIANATGGVITYGVNGALAQQAGKIETAYFSIDDGTTFNVRFVVLKSADMSAEAAKDYVSILDDLIGQFEHSLDDIKAQISVVQGDMTDLENRVDQALKDLENGNFYTKLESDDRFVKSNETPQNLLSHTNSPMFFKGNAASNGNVGGVVLSTKKMSELPSGADVWVSFDAEVTNPDNGHLAIGLEDSPYVSIAAATLDHSGHYFVKGKLPRAVGIYTTIPITIDKSAALTKITNLAMYHVGKDYGYHPAAEQLYPMRATPVNLIAEGAYFDQNASNGHDTDGRHGNWGMQLPNSATGNMTTTKHAFYDGGQNNVLVITATDEKEVLAVSSTFGVTPGHPLSWSVGLFGTSNTASVDVFIIYNNGVRNLIDQYKPSPSNIEYLSGGTRVPADATSAYFRIDNNGKTSGDSASIYLADIQVVRDAGVKSWTPSVSEFNRTNRANGEEAWGAFANRNANDFMVDSYGLKTGYIQANATNNPAGADSMRIIQTNAPSRFGIAFGLSGNPDKGMYTRVMNGTMTPNPWYKVPFSNFHGIPNDYAGGIEISNSSVAFNNYNQPGYYAFAGICHAKNLPASFEGQGMYGGLVVWSSGGVIFQEFHWDSAHVHRIITRSYAGSPAAWGPWREYQFASIS
ncbi:minor tail protein [Lactobacillus phage ATCC8014]|uniref:Minor tail protein n=1 Tax=Lactobacillus phage ATCC8014 TaxID=2892340 RepID=K4I476_9CAUD|nr:minor tail protein [Lactobacillus phage ATCC8014]AFU63025.1 minor tail protein [Lactobacillus phage ATCC8014]